MWIKSTSFNVWVRYFVWNFKGTFWNSTQNILPIHWKIWFLYNIEILRALRFKSSYAFLKRPPGNRLLPKPLPDPKWIHHLISNLSASNPNTLKCFLSCRAVVCWRSRPTAPETIVTSTKVFCTFGLNLVTIAWTGHGLSREQACDWHRDGQTDRHTKATTIPKGQNWSQVKIITTSRGQRFQSHSALHNSSLLIIHQVNPFVHSQ